VSLRHPLARVKGLGASGEGSHHWWLQRVTAIALVPLSLWFVFSVVGHIGDSHAEVLEWVSNPGIALLLVMFIGFMMYHAQLGVQVVIEDYVHTELVKLGLLLLVKGLALIVGLGGILAVLRVAL
jgi:succinate dehydrogenase / fumarate reductase membrane anchor subunit